MFKTSVFGYIIIIFIVVICLKIYQESDAFQLKCIVSKVDGNKYCVRERAKLNIAADLLATVTQKMKKVVKHMGDTYPDREECKAFSEKLPPRKSE